jgi:cation diffusion facilitator CzcD-associated flavoprotein CzcO
MSDVSVIGTGSMGSALVEVLAGSGAEVTVWNRTRETAEALSRPKIRLAESPAEALSSSLRRPIPRLRRWRGPSTSWALGPPSLPASSGRRPLTPECNDALHQRFAAASEAGHGTKPNVEA